MVLMVVYRDHRQKYQKTIRINLLHFTELR